MTQWYLIIGPADSGDRQVYKARLGDHDHAVALAERLGLGAEATILDEAAVARVGRYGYGFQLVFQIAPEVEPHAYGIGKAHVDEREAA